MVEDKFLAIDQRPHQIFVRFAQVCFLTIDVAKRDAQFFIRRLTTEGSHIQFTKVGRMINGAVLGKFRRRRRFVRQLGLHIA